jgi:UDP:flavonoid glycosyltransferase YjiC (YdhE family)
MTKRKAIFIPACIKSHVLPSFYLADLLSEDYEVVYAVGSEILGELCEKNGFKYFLLGGLKIGLDLEESYVKEKYGKVNFWRLCKTYLTNKLYWKRKALYDRILKDWQPDLVIIDIYMSTDFFVLKQYNSLNIAFFNPMPSIYTIDKSPCLSDEPETNISELGSESSKLNLLDLIKNPKLYLLQLVKDLQYAALIKKIGLSGDDMPFKSEFALLFKNIPELILLPEEFEFKLNTTKRYQMYLGLCQRSERVDTELDDSFSRDWPDILRKKKSGYRIVYCSFGTFFEGADRKLLNFVKLLSAALKDFKQVHLVCSVNEYVIAALNQEELDWDRISLFYKVPQALVLQNAAAFITHGGMGGIKEAICCEVPMIVFPLDLNYDQSSNSHKVEFHKLGLRGVLEYERVDSLRSKLKDILDNNIYRESLRGFKTLIYDRYSFDNLRSLLKENVLIEKLVPTVR